MYRRRVIGAAAATLALVVSGSPAAAAEGMFVVGRSVVLVDPQDYKCYPVTIEPGTKAWNGTDRWVSSFGDDHCRVYYGQTGPGLVGPKEYRVRSVGFHCPGNPCGNSLTGPSR